MSAKISLWAGLEFPIMYESHGRVHLQRNQFFWQQFRMSPCHGAILGDMGPLNTEGKTIGHKTEFPNLSIRANSCVLPAPDGNAAETLSSNKDQKPRLRAQWR